jgi:hypothetical protein
MSYDLEVYADRALAAEEIRNLLADAGLAVEDTENSGAR